MMNAVRCKLTEARDEHLTFEPSALPGKILTNERYRLNENNKQVIS